MKIFSAAAVIFPEIEPATDPPPLISGLGSGLELTFQKFANDLRAYQLVDSLSKAMFDNFVGLIVDSSNNLIPQGQSLYQIIIDKYNQIDGTHDVQKLYAFHLYLYVTLYHFAVWYCHERLIDPINAGLLNDTIRNYVKNEIQPKYYSGGISVAPEFFAANQFQNAFAIDGWLSQMCGPGRLGALRTADTTGDFTYLLKSGRKLTASEAAEGKTARRDIIQDFRSTLATLIDDSVKKFLVSLAAGSSATGDTLLRGYGEFRQYAVGDGSNTKSMFRQNDYGLLFFDYELVDIDDPNNLCAANRKPLPLFDSRDTGETSACFLYYGLDSTFPILGLLSPQVEFHQYADGVEMSPGTGNYVLNALSPTNYLLSGMGNNGGDLRPGDFVQRPDTVSFELRSSALIVPNDPQFLNFGPEEMVYIVFKNKIVSPRLQSSAATIKLTTQWLLPDNEFRKTPADIEAKVFDGQAQQLSALVAALALDTAFEVDASIEGLGIGRRLEKPRAGTGGLEVERAADQTDKGLPGIPAYDGLRYAHGRLWWLPSQIGTGGWLFFSVVAFVSPLRCTWEGSLQPATELNTKIKPYVPWDNQNRPSYNCVLSSFRAFALFEAMIEKILFVAFTSNDVDTAAYGRIATTLNTYLSNEARVKVLLPTGRLMTRKVAVTGGTIDEVIKLDQAFIDQFH
jgi:hypothetical protein